MRRAPGELYELSAPPTDPSLSNRDLAPTTVTQRTWSTYHIASLWIGLSVCIPTYLLAAGLVQGGMSWKQAIFTILLGNVIVAIPMVLIAHSGTRFGIPFPVLARASFGTARTASSTFSAASRRAAGRSAFSPRAMSRAKRSGR